LPVQICPKNDIDRLYMGQITKEALRETLRRFKQDLKSINETIGGDKATRYVSYIINGERITHGNVQTILNEQNSKKSQELFKGILDNQCPGNDFKNKSWNEVCEACLSIFLSKKAPPDKSHLGRIKAAFNTQKVEISEEKLCINKLAVDPAPLLDYLHGIADAPRISNMFVDGKTIELNHIYVELETAKLSGDEPTPTNSDKVDLSKVRRLQLHERNKVPICNLFDDQMHVIFGDPGSGKSTLLQQLLYLTGQGKYGGKSIPFLISLKDYAASSEKSFFEYIIKRLLGVPDDKKADWKTILTYALDLPKRMILFLDGLDEVANSQPVFSRLTEEIEDISHVASIIITSRRAGYRRPFAGEYQSYEIMELGDQAIRQLTSNWFTFVHERSKEFQEGFFLYLFEQPIRLNMARNPTLLSLLCYLNQQRDENDYLRTNRRTDLYIEAVNKLIRDHTDRTRVEANPIAWTSLEDFAFELFNSPDRIPRQLFDTRLYSNFCAKNNQPDTLLSEIWLKSKLVGQWDNNHLYFFTHLSFQEFLAARSLANLPSHEVKELADKYRYNAYWREVWQFYVGICRSESDGKERFRDLIEPVINPESRDEFGQCFFWLTPLATEFGFRESEQIHGINLKSELEALLNDGTRTTRSNYQLLLGLDTAKYFEDILFVVNEFLNSVELESLKPDRPKIWPQPTTQRPRWAEHDPKRNDKWDSLRIALTYLQYIQIPLGIWLQLELVRIQAVASLSFPADMPDLGPAPGPRNELLRSGLIKLLDSATSTERRCQLYDYLSNSPSQKAAEAMLVFHNEKTCPQEGLYILRVLAEMKNNSALEVAKTLWNELELRRKLTQQLEKISAKASGEDIIKRMDPVGDPRITSLILEALDEQERSQESGPTPESTLDLDQILDDHFLYDRYEIIHQLRNIPSDESRELLEKWLNEVQEPRLLTAILESLEVIGLSDNTAVALLYINHKDVEIREKSIDLALCRGGYSVLPKILSLVRSGAEIQNVQIAVAALGRYGYATGEIESVTNNAEASQDATTLMIAEHAMLQQSQNSSVEPNSETWYQARLDRFAQMLRSNSIQEYHLASEWIACLLTTEGTRMAFSDLFSTDWRIFGEELLRQTLDDIDNHTEWSLVEPIYEIYESKEVSLEIRLIASKILARQKNKRIYDDAKKDSRVEKELLCAAIKEGFWVFEDGWVDQIGELQPWTVT